jgi:diaminopimelate decarboxylase
MNKDNLPFSQEQIQNIVQQFGTPFHLYDEKAIRENLRDLQGAFQNIKGFKEYYAVKACPNPYILDILKEEGCGMDCSSLGELILSEAVWVKGEDIMFTSNNTTVQEFQKAQELNAIINFDDITHIDYFLENIWDLPELVCFRYNPGPLKGGNEIIGTPEDAKYGLTREQIFEAYERCKNLWVQRFGLHTMVASNELEIDYFLETAKMLFDLAWKLQEQIWVKIEFVNLGWWIGIPYRPEQKKVDFQTLAQGLENLYKEVFGDTGPNIVMECGRMVTGPYGYLLTQAIHEKHIYKEYIGVDACMADLMRPGMYGAYHHITVLGKENMTKTEIYDITGSLCENNDKFAVERELPHIDVWDILVIHDTGAHGHAMGFNYNAKLRSQEILLQENWQVKQIRRAETLDDYFRTIEYIWL